MRVIYVAGVNRKHLAEQADCCGYWLLSFGSLPKRWPEWLDSYLQGRMVLWDPGTFSPEPPTYERYLSLLHEHARPQDEALAYDVIGDGERTAWYLADMQRRGLAVVPVWQRGMGPELLSLPRCAVGGLVPRTPRQRVAVLRQLFWLPDGQLRPVGRVHLLGMGSYDLLRQVPAYSGDSRSWLAPWAWNRSRTPEEWMSRYGEQEVPLAAQGEMLPG